MSTLHDNDLGDRPQYRDLPLKMRGGHVLGMRTKLLSMLDDFIRAQFSI